MVDEGNRPQELGHLDQQVVIDAANGTVNRTFKISRGLQNQVCWSINDPAYGFTVAFDESPFHHNQKIFDDQHSCSGPARGNAREGYYSYNVTVRHKATKEEHRESKISHDPGGYVEA